MHSLTIRPTAAAAAPVPAAALLMSEGPSRASGTPLAAAACTRRPAAPCAVLNATPSMTSLSATSRAVRYPRAPPAALLIAALLTDTVSIMPASTERVPAAALDAAHTWGLISWRSLPYPVGTPLTAPSTATRPPAVLAALPRTSSSTSGFFFCGITLDGDANRSDSSTNPNSALDHSAKSSASLLALAIITAAAETNSAAKSRELVASIEFSTTPSKPSMPATASLSMGRRVPPTGPAPSGLRLARANAPANLPWSRSSASAWASR